MTFQPGQSTKLRRGGVLIGARRIWRENRRKRLQAPPPTLRNRILDGIPGALMWVSFILVIAGTVFAPVVVFTVAASIGAYMALRMAAAGVANLLGVRHIRRWEATDWRAQYLRQRRADSLRWEDVRHLVIIPNYKEDITVLRATLERLAASPLAREQIIIALAMEASDPNAASTAATLRTEFEGRFLAIHATLHPRGIVGEVAGKSSNVAWAAKHVQKMLCEDTGMCLDHTVITVSDADSILHPRYLEALTCQFATTSHRMSAIWQAPIRYNGNVWDVHPALAIVQAYSAAWELAYLAGSWWQGLPISTYSLSLRLAHDVGYWDTDVIAEDWHMFIKCYFGRKGLLQIEPIYLPFSAYSVTGDGFIDSCRNRYNQTLRHAWGAKEMGYTIRLMMERPIPFHRALRVFLRVSHDNLMAGAGWMIMTVGTQLPLILNPGLFLGRIFSPEFLIIQGALVTVAAMGMLFYWIDLKMRPPRSHPWRLGEVVLTGGSFIALGILVLILVALPAIEAQTRLMLGVSLEYKVARKV
ncbi:MAG TPA: glycosyltransferase family 2 protein [Aggregatilineales bacterium]|nr:glycosyltransferase family 2 protein [Anaerolineales bacterium]HRE47838.1 glycosyltransferase family 2 protein [Aggregatilineales bacterium]